MSNNLMNISDPNILLSIVNMKLRDQYHSLDSLCDDLDLSKEYITEKMKNINYEYSIDENQFKEIK